jgi:hypothetical protein
MTRTQYLKLRFGPDDRLINVLRAGVLAVAGIILIGIIHNISILLWSIIRLAGS